MAATTGLTKNPQLLTGLQPVTGAGGSVEGCQAAASSLLKQQLERQQQQHWCRGRSEQGLTAPTLSVATRQPGMGVTMPPLLLLLRKLTAYL